MWRLRCLIHTESPFEQKNIVVNNGLFEYVFYDLNEKNWIDPKTLPQYSKFCDILIKKEIDDIYEAFAILFDKLNEMLDRISFVTYGFAKFITIYSICTPVVKIGDKFEIGMPQAFINREFNVISPQKLFLPVDTEIKDWHRNLLRLFRTGYNSDSDGERYLNYYGILEEIASEESVDYIMNKCTNCDNEINTGRKKTNKFIEDILVKHDVPKELIKNASKIRGKLAHGGGVRNKKFFADVQHLASYFEEIVLIELENRIGLKVQNRGNVHLVDIPIVVHKAFCDPNGNFGLIGTKSMIASRFVTFKNKYEEGNTVASAIGMPLDKNNRPIIHHLAWPQVD